MPTLEEVRDKIERRYAKALGSAELQGQTVESRMLEVEQATMSMDDSDGDMGSILQWLQDLHLEACRKAKPDPVALGERLFDWEMRSEFDTFDGAVETYAELLGERGLAAYRRCAEAAWSDVPAGEHRPGRGYRDGLSGSRCRKPLDHQAADAAELIDHEAATD